MSKLAIIRTVWSVCFLAGAFNHARDIVSDGWLPYTFMPMPFNVFWTALLPLDVLAATLIWVRPKWGALLGLMIMIFDVTINFWTVYGAGHDFGIAPLLQVLFLIFTAGTARTIAAARPTWAT